MALNIEGATVGYDVNGIEKYIADINTNVVEKACRELNANLTNLRVTVDKIWVGKSAETFKTNMEHDVDSICAALRESVESLVSDLRDAGSYLGEVDENLIQPR